MRSYDCRNCVLGRIGHVTWRLLSSGFKIVHLPTCLIRKCSVFSMNTIIKPDDFRKAFWKSKVPDYSTVLCVVTRFSETCSASDQKGSGRHTAFNDVSVEDILHLLVRYSRKSLMHEIFCNFLFFLKLVVLLFDHSLCPHRQICYRIKEGENV
jgi:hypothetical protein